MQSKESPPRHLPIGAIVGTIVALGVFGLSIHAIAQGVLQQRLVHIVQGLAPLVFSGWALRVLGGFWVGLFRNRSSPD